MRSKWIIRARHLKSVIFHYPPAINHVALIDYKFGMERSHKLVIKRQLWDLDLYSFPPHPVFSLLVAIRSSFSDTLKKTAFEPIKHRFISRTTFFSSRDDIH